MPPHADTPKSPAPSQHPLAWAAANLGRPVPLVQIAQEKMGSSPDPGVRLIRFGSSITSDLRDLGQVT